jgi:DNA-binding SARP family transcriptional activator
VSVLAVDAAVPSGIRICVLGTFRVLQVGRPSAVRRGSKAEHLLGNLALSVPGGLPRDELLGLVWPESESPLARQSLNSLVYALRRTLADGLGGRSPILEDDGRLRLNVDAHAYESAISLYAGDLVLGSAVRHVVERERLRARYLASRAHLADHNFDVGRYEEALEDALRLLTDDPCREDAHRMAMRCYVRLGARAQAVRQYRICQRILAEEFDAQPEPSTVELFDLVRLDPERV